MGKVLLHWKHLALLLLLLLHHELVHLGCHHLELHHEQQLDHVEQLDHAEQLDHVDPLDHFVDLDQVEGFSMGISVFAHH